MTMGTAVAKDERTLTVRVPMVLRKRGGRKVVLGPDCVTRTPPPRRIDNAMVKALARAFRWRKLIETDTYATVAEIATAERVNDSYVSRVLRLTLLAPDIVEAVMNGRQPVVATLSALLMPFSAEWEAQRREIIGRRKGPP
jgi:hypothetical protein